MLIYSMTIYECNRCSKKYDHKGDYTRHIERKRPCKAKIVEAIEDEIIEQVIEENEESKDYISTVDDNEINVCKLCSATFCNKYSLERHMMGRCKVIKQKKSRKINSAS